MRLCPLVLCGLAAVSCNSSNSNSPPVIAAATIGPEGGVITVDSGVQTGLMLTVPAGALTTPTTILIRDLTPRPTPGTVAHPAVVSPPGQPFLVEPALRFEQLATLRAPYRPTAVIQTGPGNVRARHTRNGDIIDIDPTVVDVQNGRIELPISFTGQYQVIQAMPADFLAYRQQPGTVVSLADGLTFGVEDVPAQSPFAGPSAQRWRITVPDAEDLLYFDADRLRGRESVTDNWRETWSQSCPVWIHASQAPMVGALATATQVSRPMTSPPIGGLMTAFGMWSWVEPRRVGAQELRDVLWLRVTLAWNRHDLGVGQREYQFWFAPGHGLIAFAQDGVIHPRLAL
ncbi:MAG TPA: hypothetical protein VFD82_03080 [Planctomycetota bacterium]|nr:hypothetical protein [Planctomycetota bacterium]